QAGASSLWASCCGLMNEVMGTGAVRGQQPVFGAGAGPFRFAPSAGYSTYPPASSGTSGLVCKACGQAFSVFRRKPSSDLGSMRLRVRDLRQYLLLHSIPIDTCREKEDLVDLVLRHQSTEEEERADGGSLHSSSFYTPSPSATQSTSELSAYVASQDEPLSRSDSSNTNQDTGDAPSEPLLNMDSSEHTPENTVSSAVSSLLFQASPRTWQRSRASLSDVSSVQDIEILSVKQLKEILARNYVNYSGCCEKWELVERVSRLYRERKETRRSDSEKAPLTVHDDNLCRICMDATIDCVLLECGHMVTCTKCGKRMNECPICRQYVVRAVHVFKS
ncbi:unnamed protein product, partial [Tetraodon nigroviridis]